MSLNNNKPNGFLFGLLAGGAVGTIVALLTALKNGKKFRGDIKQIKAGERLNELSSAK